MYAVRVELPSGDVHYEAPHGTAVPGSFSKSRSPSALLPFLFSGRVSLLK